MSVRILSPAPRGRAVLALLGLLALALAVGGCGRIGPLEPPGGVPKQAAPASTSPADQAAGLNARKIPPIEAPKRDLPIDFLLK